MRKLPSTKLFIIVLIIFSQNFSLQLHSIVLKNSILLQFTQEMTFKAFLQWLKALLVSSLSNSLTSQTRLIQGAFAIGISQNALVNLDNFFFKVPLNISYLHDNLKTPHTCRFLNSYIPRHLESTSKSTTKMPKHHLAHGFQTSYIPQQSILDLLAWVSTHHVIQL